MPALPLSCGTNTIGQLAVFNCEFGSNFDTYDFALFGFAAPAGAHLRVRAATDISVNLDPQLALYDPSGALAGISDDEVPTNRADVLEATLAAAGTWTVMVTSETPGFGSRLFGLEVSCPTPPSAQTIATPTNLTASIVSRETVRLTWRDNATNELEYRVESRIGDSSYVQLGSIPANSNGVDINGHSAGAPYSFRVRAAAGTEASAYSNAASVLFPTSSCQPDSLTACLLDGRFQVRVIYENAETSGFAGVMFFDQQRATNDQSAFFYFTDPTNFEMGVKMVAGCPLNNQYWFFVSGLTDQEWVVEVYDTSTGAVKYYQNTLGNLSETTGDTSAFSCTP